MVNVAVSQPNRNDLLAANLVQREVEIKVPTVVSTSLAVIRPGLSGSAANVAVESVAGVGTDSQ